MKSSTEEFQERKKNKRTEKGAKWAHHGHLFPSHLSSGEFPHSTEREGIKGSLIQKFPCACARVCVCTSTHTPDHTGRISRRSSGSSHTDTSCRTDARGDHTAGSCTPDWTNYLKTNKQTNAEQNNDRVKRIGMKRHLEHSHGKASQIFSHNSLMFMSSPFFNWILAHNLNNTETWSWSVLVPRRTIF